MNVWPLTVVALLATASLTARAAEDPTLWRGKRFGACDIEVVHESGALRLQRERGAPRLQGAATWIVAEEATDGGRVRLVLSPAAGTAAVAGADEVILRAAPACRVALRTLDRPIGIFGRHRAPIHAETRTGDIDFPVSPDSHLNVVAATSGNLTVDFSVDLDYRRHSEPSKTGSLVVGDGGIEVRLTSKRGAIRVLEARRSAAATAHAGR